jgi:hypothetical protein
MAYGAPDWVFPSITPDVWGARRKNTRDWLGFGFFLLIFTIVFYGYLSTLAAAVGSGALSIGTVVLILGNFAGIGFFLFIFAFIVLLLTLTVESVGYPLKYGSLALNSVFYGKITTLKGFAFQLMIGILIGLAFADGSLLPLSTATLAVSSLPTSGLENVMVAALFGALEELWRAGTFEPLLGNLFRGGAELPILLIFFGMFSFFVPSFLSVAWVGLALISSGILLALLIRIYPPLQYSLRLNPILRHITIIIVGVLTWVLYHVYTASTQSNPYALYLNAVGFGFIVDALDWIFQSIVTSYTGHVVNNSIVAARQLGYSVWIAIETILVFLSFLAIPVLTVKDGVQ